MASQQQPIVTADGKVGLQGNKEGTSGVLRHRIPADILAALESEDGSYIRWAVYDDGEGGKYAMGWPISAKEAQPRSLIAERQESAKPKTAKKAGAKKGKGNGADPFGGAFDDDEDDDEDDGGFVPAPTPTRRRPTPVGTAKTVAPPVTGTPTKQGQPRRPAPPATSSSVRQPRVAGPLPKPSQRRASGVRYEGLPDA